MIRDSIFSLIRKRLCNVHIQSIGIYLAMTVVDASFNIFSHLQKANTYSAYIYLAMMVGDASFNIFSHPQKATYCVYM